jgi:hypothetical protein
MHLRARLPLSHRHSGRERQKPEPPLNSPSEDACQSNLFHTVTYLEFINNDLRSGPILIGGLADTLVAFRNFALPPIIGPLLQQSL